jgi:hypothetical protein
MSTPVAALLVIAAWTLTWFACLRLMCRAPQVQRSPTLIALRTELAQLQADDEGPGR